MSVVNFSVTKPFEKKINEAIKTYGFSSKAEFFRFAAFRFVEELKTHSSDEEEYERSMKALSARLKKKYSKKSPPSLEDQLADLR